MSNEFNIGGRIVGQTYPRCNVSSNDRTNHQTNEESIALRIVSLESGRYIEGKQHSQVYTNVFTSLMQEE